MGNVACKHQQKYRHTYKESHRITPAYMHTKQTCLFPHQQLKELRNVKTPTRWSVTVSKAAIPLSFSRAERWVTAPSAPGVVVSGAGCRLATVGAVVVVVVVVLHIELSTLPKGVVTKVWTESLPGCVAGSVEARGRAGVLCSNAVGETGVSWISDWKNLQRFSLPAVSEVSNVMWVWQHVVLK